ncbi:MAG: serine/threonine-protein kinase, partial [Gemmataceae bacterium]
MNTETVVFGLVQEYLAAKEAGRPIDRADLLARRPEVAEALTRCLDALDFVQGVAGDGPAPGSAFGEFRLLGELGRGGMGVVYEAEQPALGRRVALKVLPGAAALDGRHRQRFLNEARAAAGLHHPHIVPVHSVGEAGGTPFFAMQKIDGRPLAGKLAPVEAARLIAQAADALAYAHAQGVIHRDVKPGNLLVEPSGHLWVVDFGLARVDGVAGLSATADVLGTPRYMSPEQAAGAPLDHRTDQFSLALTLYEALAGRPAYGGTTREAVLRQALTAEPPAPDVPRDLRTIVGKALARDPAGRYPGCREFADDLRRFVEGRPIVARPEGLGRRAGRWAWRRRAVLAAGLLALVAGLGVAVGVLLVKNAEVSAAERQARQGKADAEEALALKEEALYRLNVSLAWREWE